MTTAIASMNLLMMKNTGHTSTDFYLLKSSSLYALPNLLTIYSSFRFANLFTRYFVNKKGSTKMLVKKNKQAIECILTP